MPRISGRYDLADFVQAQKLHNQHNWFLKIAVYLSMGMMGLLSLASLYLAVVGRVDWITAVIPLGFFVLVGAFRFFVLPLQYRRIFQQHKELSLPFECDLTHQALIFRNERGSTTLPWLEIVQYRVDRHMFLIYRTDTMFHMLPLRLFKDQITLNFLNDRLHGADIPPARWTFNLIQVLLLLIFAVGILFMISIVIWPMIAL